jgi:hypothetical protein
MSLRRIMLRAFACTTLDGQCDRCSSTSQRVAHCATRCRPRTALIASNISASLISDALGLRASFTFASITPSALSCTASPAYSSSHSSPCAPRRGGHRDSARRRQGGWRCTQRGHTCDRRRAISRGSSAPRMVPADAAPHVAVDSPREGDHRIAARIAGHDDLAFSAFNLARLAA